MTHSPSSDLLKKESPMLRIGGGLAIASCIIGIAIFVAACFGLSAAFSLSFLPVTIGAVALILSIIGGSNANVRQTEPTHVLASLFVAVFGILGGLVLMSVWLHWIVFAKTM